MNYPGGGDGVLTGATDTGLVVLAVIVMLAGLVVFVVVVGVVVLAGLVVLVVVVVVDY